jgi:hypothetical protein
MFYILFAECPYNIQFPYRHAIQHQHHPAKLKLETLITIRHTKYQHRNQPPKKFWMSKHGNRLRTKLAHEMSK